MSIIIPTKITKREKETIILNNEEGCVINYIGDSGYRWFSSRIINQWPSLGQSCVWGYNYTFCDWTPWMDLPIWNVFFNKHQWQNIRYKYMYIYTVYKYVINHNVSLYIYIIISICIHTLFYHIIHIHILYIHVYVWKFFPWNACKTRQEPYLGVFYIRRMTLSKLVTFNTIMMYHIY